MPHNLFTMAEEKKLENKVADQAALIKELEKKSKLDAKVIADLETKSKLDASAIEKHVQKESDDATTISNLEGQLKLVTSEKDQYKAKIAELEASIKTFESNSSVPNEKVFKNKKVTVHHGVNIPKMGKFTKEEILANAEVQDYLLEIKSSAVSLNK